MPNNSPDLVRGQVTLPGALVDAAAAGELVVFAGAGVSKNPPAKYPDFEGLADELTEHAHQPRRDGEDIDAYLGRIEKAPRLVGEMARQYFLDRPSPATSVHEALVNLFPSQADTRIVTTNYDDLFEKADPELPVWSALAHPPQRRSSKTGLGPAPSPARGGLRPMGAYYLSFRRSDKPISAL